MTNLVGILCGDKIFKRVFCSTLVLIVISSCFLSSFVQVFAQGGPNGGPGPVPNNPLPIGGPGTFPLPGNGGGTAPPSPTPGTGEEVGGGRGSGAGGPRGDAEIAAAQEAARANALAASESLGSTPDGVLGFFHSYVLTGVGWVVGQAGKAFDYAIENFIIGFGDLYINKNIGNTIDTLWSTVRDIFNLTFIFGLVYIGFKMILDSSDSGARKMLISLIGAALLVNFSLFITKFVVDFSNIAAAQIWKAFESSGELSITNGFMTLMGINSLIGVPYTAGGSFAYVIGMLIVFAVLAYVFLAGAIMIIIRFVVLNIYMVFSPMMFLGWVFPAMKGYSEKYWSGFLKQAFFAPAFLFMLYLSYLVAASFNFNQKDFGHMFNPNGSSVTEAAGLIPFFAMVIVFLCASMVVAKNMGAVGAATAVSVGNNLRGRAQTAILSGPRYLGRTVIGASANQLGKLNDKLEGSRTGRFVKGGLSAVTLGALNERNRQNLVKVGKSAKLGGSYSYQDDKDFSETLAATQATEKNKAAAKKAVAEGQLALQTPAAARTREQEESVRKMQAVIADMSTKQLEVMSDKQRVAIAGELTSAQTEALMKSDKIGADDKAAISEKRKRVIKDVVESGGKVMTAALTELSTTQIETMGDSFILANAADFSEEQFKEVIKSKKFTENQVARYKSTRKASVTDRINSGNKDRIDSVFKKSKATASGNGVMITNDIKKAKEIAALPGVALTSHDAVEYITVDVVKEIVSQKNLSDDERRTLKNNVLDPANGNKHRKKLEAYFRTPKGIDEFGV